MAGKETAADVSNRKAECIRHLPVKVSCVQAYLENRIYEKNIRSCGISINIKE